MGWIVWGRREKWPAGGKGRAPGGPEAAHRMDWVAGFYRCVEETGRRYGAAGGIWHQTSFVVVFIGPRLLGFPFLVD